MSAISDYANKVDAHQVKIDTALEGVGTDVSEMKKLIETLQTTPGPISPEDQATLDRLESKVGTTVAKLEALDDLTPPPAPNP